MTRLFASLLALLLCLGAELRAQELNVSSHTGPWGAWPCSASYAITDVTVLPMDGERVLSRYTVFIDGGLITAMGRSAELRVPGGVTRIDGTGKYLIPGLSEMHIHLGQGPGESANDALGRQFRLALAHGVTTLRGVIAPPSALQARDRVNRGELLGPTLLVAAPSLNGQSVPDPETGRRLVLQAQAKGYDLLKTHGGMSAESYAAIVLAAKEARLPLAGHVSPSYGLDRAMRAGQQIEHLDGYIAAALPPDVPTPHGQIIADDVVAQVDWSRARRVAEETKRAGVWNGMTMALFRVLAGGMTAAEHAARPEMRYVPAATLAQWGGYLSNGPGALPGYLAARDSIAVALYRAGARLLVSADAPQIFLVTGFGTHQEMQAMVQAGIPPYAVLEAATRSAAEYLRRKDSGVVAVGKRADLVLLDADPLSDIRNAGRIAGVMVAGKWLDRAALDGLLLEVEQAASR